MTNPALDLQTATVALEAAKRPSPRLSPTYAKRILAAAQAAYDKALQAAALNPTVRA